MRRVTQVFEKTGELIAENDPNPETFSITDLMDFAGWCIENNKTQISVLNVQQWLD